MSAKLQWTTKDGASKAEGYGFTYRIDGKNYYASIFVSEDMFFTYEKFEVYLDKEKMAKAWCQSHHDAVCEAMDMAMNATRIYGSITTNEECLKFYEQNL
jgi:hypothetical protein